MDLGLLFESWSFFSLHVCNVTRFPILLDFILTNCHYLKANKWVRGACFALHFCLHKAIKETFSYKIPQFCIGGYRSWKNYVFFKPWILFVRPWGGLMHIRLEHVHLFATANSKSKIMAIIIYINSGSSYKNLCYFHLLSQQSLFTWEMITKFCIDF